MFLLLLALAFADTSRTIRIPVAPGESLAVTVVGHGAPAVLLPGLFGSSYGYRHVMALLDSAGYRSIAIEPLGMGSSSRPAIADYSLTAQADRVATVLDSLSVTRAVLVGHSLGASIALRLAYRHPDMVRGIVSLEGGPAESATSAGFRRWMRFAPVWKLFDTRRVVQQMLYVDLKEKSFDDSWVQERVLAEYTKGLTRDTEGTIKAYRAMGKSPEPELLQDHLPAISCPVVLLVGDVKHGAGPPNKEVSVLRQGLPQFSMDTIPRSGFFIQEEQPQAVADAVRGIQQDGTC